MVYSSCGNTSNTYVISTSKLHTHTNIPPSCVGLAVRATVGLQAASGSDTLALKRRSRSTSSADFPGAQGDLNRDTKANLRGHTD